jgi:hypothetical protein
MYIKQIFIIAFFFVTVEAAAQDQIVARGDTLVLPGGSKFWLGEEVTLGNGSLPDRSFTSIYFPLPLNIVKKQTLKSEYAGQKAIIKKFQRDGAYKKTYSYNILVLEFNDKRRFWCDVQEALAANEIIDNNAVNRGGQAQSKEQRLASLKKLYDSGQITQDEYETLKNKILNEKDTAPKKTNDGPVVF